MTAVSIKSRFLKKPETVDKNVTVKHMLNPISFRSVDNIKGSEIDDKKTRDALKALSDKTYHKYKGRLSV